MTREEAVKRLKEYAPQYSYGIYRNGEGDGIAFDMAIKALDQEPCEDAVSRQAVLDKAYAYGNGLEPEGYCVEVEDIQALPPVTPTRKKGEWIVYPLLDEGRVELVCPICEDTFIRAVDHKPHFCENCGARMESDE